MQRLKWTSGLIFILCAIAGTDEQARGQAAGQGAGASQPGTIRVPPGTTPPIPPNAGAPPAVAPAPGAAPAPVLKRENDPQAMALVENYIKAIGGKEMLAKVKDRVTSFRNIKYQSTGSTVAEISLFMKDHFNIREEWEIKGFDIKGKPLAFVQIYNGEQEEAWVQMLGTVSPLEGKTLSVFVWEKYMDDFFCHWDKDGYTVSMAGQGLVEDEPCDIVLVMDYSGRSSQRYFFSKQSGLILKKEWTDTAANAKAPVKREQYYKMYRDLPFLDGSGLSVKFPLRLEIFGDGDLDTERVFTNVRFNSGLKSALFEKPEGIDFQDFQKGMANEAIPGGPGASSSGSKPPEGSHPKIQGAGTPTTAAPTAPPNTSATPAAPPGQPSGAKPPAPEASTPPK
jgi:hypothetical protein